MKTSLHDFIQKRAAVYQAPVPMTHVIYGYPTIEDSLAWMETLLAQGVDILEVQFPFSDPVADGPTIANACYQALINKPDLSQCLKDIEPLRQAYPNSKILFMSYLNPIYRFGIQKFIHSASQAGITGTIIPDLPIEQADDYRESCQQYNLIPIWLITPATPNIRIKKIVEQASDMLYCVSRSGVTGQKENALLSHSLKSHQSVLAEYIHGIQSHIVDTNPMSLAVGFGIRTPEQVQALNGVADVAIVGSALLEAYNAGREKEGIQLVQSLFPYLSKKQAYGTSVSTL